MATHDPTPQQLWAQITQQPMKPATELETYQPYREKHSMTENPMASYVEVHRNIPMLGEPKPRATVSWSSIGSRTPEAARQFAAAILAAADKADRMNKDTA